MDLKGMMDHRFLLLLSLGYSLIAITSTADSPGRCLAGWQNFGEFCYIVGTGLIRYDQAIVACEKKGMKQSRLASIHDAEEQAFVQSQLGNTTSWIGLQRDKSSKYTWEDGSTYSYTNWVPLLEGCVFNTKYGWATFNCNYAKERHLCKAPADSSGRCLAGWENFGDFCYFLDATMSTYDQAKDGCASKIPGKSKLASILHAEEQAFLQKMAMVLNVWIGLRKDTSELFNWEDGSTLNYNKFRCPVWSGPRAELCVYNNNNGWYTTPCFVMLKQHICKAPAATPDSTTSEPDTSATTSLQTSTTSPAPITDSSGRCLAGWENFGEFCYIVGRGQTTYEQAIVACEKKGKKQSRLASILDAEEQAFVDSQLGDAQYFIGLKKDTSGKHSWEDGSTFNYTNWGVAQPYSPPISVCVFNRNNEWATTLCQLKRKSICKAPADSPGKCLFGWQILDEFCYFFNKAMITYEQAKDGCASKIPGKSKLASILHAKEHAFIQAMVGRFMIWIGLRLDSSNRKFTWEDGSTLNYTKWRCDQPVTYLLHLCVTIRYKKWVTAPCHEAIFHHLCKTPAG